MFTRPGLLLREALAKNRIDDATKLVESIPEKMAKRPQGRFLQAQLALARGDAAKAYETGPASAQGDAQLRAAAALCWRGHQQLGQIPDAENMLGRPSSSCRKTGACVVSTPICSCRHASRPAHLTRSKAVIDSGKVDADTLLIYGRAQMAQGNFAAADARLCAGRQITT